MALYVRDGFEHNSLTTFSATTGSPAIVTSPVRTDTYALEISASAAAEWVRYAIPTGNQIVATSFYVRFATLPTADVRIAHATGTVESRFWFRTTNDRFAIAFSGSVVEGGPNPVLVDTWYLVDIEWNTTTNPLVAKCKIDGGTEFQQTNATAAQDTTNVGLGTTAGDTFTALYDDWGISLTTDYPIGAHEYFDPTRTLRVGADRRAGGW